jgi:hypothetical protein
MLPLVGRLSSCGPARARTAARDSTVIMVHRLAGTGKEYSNTADITEGINESCLMDCNTELPYTLIRIFRRNLLHPSSGCN